MIYYKVDSKIKKVGVSSFPNGELKISPLDLGPYCEEAMLIMKWESSDDFFVLCAVKRLLDENWFVKTTSLFVPYFPYSRVDRRIDGQALKSTYAVVNGEEKFLSKDLKTDDGTKKSNTGMVAVVEKDGELITIDGLTAFEKERLGDLLAPVWRDGRWLKPPQTLEEIREILR